MTDPFVIVDLQGRTHTITATLTDTVTTPAPPVVVKLGSMPAELAAAHTWTPDLAQDFTKQTQLDPSVLSQGWFPPSPGSNSWPVNGGEAAAYSPKNLAFTSEGLQFKLTNEPCTVPGYPTQLHTGALVTSNGLHNITPNVYIEARMKIPGNAAGAWDWPGFWLNGQSWPGDGEIDIIEILDSYAAWHYHWGENGKDTEDKGGNVGKPTDYVGWHAFGCYWTPSRIDVYYDGKLVGSVTKNVTSTPHYLILGNSTGNKGRVGSVMTCSSINSWTHP